MNILDVFSIVKKVLDLLIKICDFVLTNFKEVK